MLPEKVNELIDERNRRQLFVLILDISHSMAGLPIDMIKEAAIEFARRYFEMRKAANQEIQLIAIPFNKTAQVIEAKNLEDFESMIHNLQASGTT